MPTVEERLVSLEERLAALERRLPPAPSPALPAGTLPPLPPLPRRETEEEWWQRATQGRKPIGAEALQRM